jgi:hypothetical protein
VACICSQLALDGLEIPDNVGAVAIFYCPYRFRLNSSSHVASRQPGNLGEERGIDGCTPLISVWRDPWGFIYKRDLLGGNMTAPCVQASAVSLHLPRW